VALIKLKSVLDFKNIVNSYKDDYVRDLNNFEITRLLALISTFTFLWLLGVVIQNFSNLLDGHIYTGSAGIWVNIYYIVILAFFVLQLLWARSRIKKRKNFNIGYLLISSTIELLILCGFAVLLTIKAEDLFFIKSLCIMHLLVCIVMSTMRLRIFISVVVGVVGSVGYFFIAMWGSENFEGLGAFDDSRYAFYAIIILLFGCIAEYLSYQIYARVLKTVVTNKQMSEMERIFGQQLNPKVVEQLTENKGEMDAKQVIATIMFFDIRDFTSFAESKTAKEVFNHQNLIFDPLIRIVDTYEGIINQITGDGFMAVFGITTKASDHANNAFKAGLAIIETIHKMSENGDIEPTNAGVGLQTGKLIIGNIGNEVRKQFSVSGINVIVAARLEKLNKVHNSNIIISEDVKKRLKGFDNQLISLGSIDVRGFDEPILAFKVT